MGTLQGCGLQRVLSKTLTGTSERTEQQRPQHQDRRAHRKTSPLLRWKTLPAEWKSSKRYAGSNAIDATLPSDNYLHIIDQLRRNQASLLTQLRTGHIPLNAVLHRIERSETADCPHCKDGIRETVHHFLLTCPTYAGPRRLLQARLKRDTSSIPFLIGTRKGIPHLLRYISDTKRLRTIFGEVRPDEDFELKEKQSKEKNNRRREETNEP